MEFLLSEPSIINDRKIDNDKKLTIIDNEIKRINEIENKIESKITNNINQLNNLKFDVYKTKTFYETIINNLGQ
jgi:hypothetical protein